jgi:hypothetical protein
MASQEGFFIVIWASRGLGCSVAWERTGSAEAAASKMVTIHAQGIPFDKNIVKEASPLAFFCADDRQKANPNYAFRYKR